MWQFLNEGNWRGKRTRREKNPGNRWQGSAVFDFPKINMVLKSDPKSHLLLSNTSVRLFFFFKSIFWSTRFEIGFEIGLIPKYDMFSFYQDLLLSCLFRSYKFHFHDASIFGLDGPLLNGALIWMGSSGCDNPSSVIYLFFVTSAFIAFLHNLLTCSEWLLRVSTAQVLRHTGSA